MKNLALVGAAGGAVATVAMTALMAGAQQVGLLGKMPPRRIVDAAARWFGGRPRSEPLRDALTAGAHLGFGSVAGAFFGAFLPPAEGRLPRPLVGAIYGAGVWALSYAGWIPALGILPRPSRDRPACWALRGFVSASSGSRRALALARARDDCVARAGRRKDSRTGGRASYAGGLHADHLPLRRPGLTCLEGAGSRSLPAHARR